MNKSEQVAKLIERVYGLKVLPKTYRRLKRDWWADHTWRWAMDADDSQFPAIIPSLAGGSLIRGTTWQEKRDMMGLYDFCHDTTCVTSESGSNFVVGSDNTFQEILDHIEDYGETSFYLVYKDGEFSLELTSVPPKHFVGHTHPVVCATCKYKAVERSQCLCADSDHFASVVTPGQAACSYFKSIYIFLFHS